MGWSDKIEETEELGFEEAVENGEVDTISPTDVKEEVSDCGDVELLRKAEEQDPRKTVRKVYQDRLDELEVQSDSEETETEETQDTEETESEEPEIESIGSTEEAQQDADANENGPEGDGSDDGPDIDLNRLAPDSMGIDEAVDKDHTWKVMVWGGEGMGKTHFAYTMPEPIMLIDTENKAEDIASKFSDKEINIWQPKGFDEAIESVEQALDVLQKWEQATGDKGTLVVDSMSVMWEWSQQKYISEYYPNTPPEDVNLDLQNWSKIKDYHNAKFRKKMEECEYHICWTEMQKDDVGSKIENSLDYTPVKPAGETNNKYKVNDIIQLKLDSEGVPTGFQRKSGKNRYKYIGLTRPTFDKHVEVVNAISEAESKGVNGELELQSEIDLPDGYSVKFTEANTMEMDND